MRKSNQRIVNHGNGKGDKSRVTDSATYQANLHAVQFSGVPASQDPSFSHQGGKSVKRYGSAALPTTFATITGRIIIN